MFPAGSHTPNLVGMPTLSREARLTFLRMYLALGPKVTEAGPSKILDWKV